MKINPYILISLLTVYRVCCDNEETRNLKAEYNPGCSKKLNASSCDEFIFAHITAESEANTLHYLFDFIGKPSVLIAKTAKNTSLNIDWETIRGNTKNINFTSEPEYVFATVINKFILFNDTNDSGNYSDPSNVDVVDFDPLSYNWTKMNFTESNGTKVTLEVYASNINNGSISLKFTAFGTKQHHNDLPKLLHTADSMQIDIIADKIQSKYSQPRIAMELLLVSSENQTEGPFKMNRNRNLDDEFTPGIFDVYNLVSPKSNNDTKGGFIQYRPVCYTSHYRSVSYSTESRHGNLQYQQKESYEHSMPYNYFGMKGLNYKLKEAINVTFGMPGDGFYSHTNYISFSFLMGMGSPAVEQLSTFVKIFSAVGLGVPLLVMIVGGIYVACKRYRN